MRRRQVSPSLRISQRRRALGPQFSTPAGIHASALNHQIQPTLRGWRAQLRTAPSVKFEAGMRG
jgi:hypothetical protein